MKVNNSVGKRINKIRLSLGETMGAFGERFGTSKGTVNNWEKGRNMPNKENLKAIANLGNITIEELLYGVEYEIIELVKSELSELEKETNHPEYFQEDEETKMGIILETIQTLKSLPVFQNKPFEELPIKIYLEDRFCYHYYKTHITNQTAIDFAITKLTAVREDIADYFEAFSTFNYRNNTQITVSVFHENLNSRLGDEILNLIDSSIDGINEISQKYPDEDSPSVLELNLYDMFTKDSKGGLRKLDLTNVSKDEVIDILTLIVATLRGNNNYSKYNDRELFELSVSLVEKLLA